MATDERVIPRNYRLGIVNGVLFMGGSAFLDPHAVVAVFLLGLGASRFVVGLASGASIVGFLLPTLLMAHPIETAERKLPYYVVSTVSRVASLGLLVVAVLWLGPTRPYLLCALTVVLLFAFRASIATGVLPFFEIVGHSVPARRRGRFFAWRIVLGSLLGIGAGVAVSWLLDAERSGLTFSQGYAVVFGLGLLLCGSASMAFCLVKEPPMPVDRRGMGLLAKLREGWSLTREDANYRRLLVCRVASAATTVATPFYVIYCLNALGVPKDEPEQAAVFLIAAKVSTLVAFPLWARISDGQGNARLLRIGAVLGLMPPLLALGLPLVPQGLAAWRWVVAIGLYVLSCGAVSAFQLGAMNYLMEAAPPERRPLYIAMCYAWIAPVALLAAPFGGWLADSPHAGYRACFALAVLFGVVVARAAFGLAEPREAQHEDA
jgi:MFS family permease